MNYFEKQMRILFGESELFSEAMCSGKMMIGKIDQDVRVKLEFISTNIAKQYNAMKVTVLNRTEGEIDKTVYPSVLHANYRYQDAPNRYITLHLRPQGFFFR